MQVTRGGTARNGVISEGWGEQKFSLKRLLGDLGKVYAPHKPTGLALLISSNVSRPIEPNKEKRLFLLYIVLGMVKPWAVIATFRETYINPASQNSEECPLIYSFNKYLLNNH